MFVPFGWGGGSDSLIKVGTDEWAWALDFSGVKFCSDFRFWAIFDKKCVISDKRVKK